MSRRTRMLRTLPEARRLLDRVPLAVVRLGADAVTLRWLAVCTEQRTPLRDMCAVLRVPWHGRRVPAEWATRAMLGAARALSPEVFCPLIAEFRAEAATPDAVFGWADRVRDAYMLCPEGRSDVLWWVARRGAHWGTTASVATVVRAALRSARVAPGARMEAILRRAEHRVGAPADAIRTLCRGTDGRIYPSGEFRSRRYADEDLRKALTERYLNPGPLPSNTLGYGNSEVVTLTTREDFRIAGRAMGNCIGELFSACYLTGYRIAVYGSGAEQVAGTYDQDGRLVYVRTAANGSPDGRSWRALCAHGTSATPESSCGGSWPSALSAAMAELGLGIRGVPLVLDRNLHRVGGFRWDMRGIP